MAKNYLYITMKSFYQDILKESGAGYWEWNIQTQTGFFSPEFKAMLGYEPDEMNSMLAFWEKMIPPDDLTHAVSIYNKFISSKGKVPYRNELRYMHKTGVILWMSSFARIVKFDTDNNPLIIAGCIIDITEKKENGIALLKIKTFLNDATETAIIGAWELDLTTGSLYWDNTTKKIHGVDLNYKPSLDTAIDFYKEGINRDLISKAVSLAIQNGTSYDLELELTTASGQTIEIRTIGHVDFKDGKCIRLHGLIRDIDKQNKTEKQLEISEGQFDGIFDHSATGMAIISTKGQYLRINNRFCEILGYTHEELLNLTIKDVTHPDDIENDKNNLVYVLEGKAKSFHVEKRYIHKTGSIIWADLTVTLVRDSKGLPLHFLGQAVDISKNKKTTEELLRVNQELEAILNSGTEVSIISTNLDGIITHFSKGAENLLGYKAEELIGLVTPSFIHVKEEVIEHAKYLSQHLGEKIKVFDTFIAFAKRGLHEEKEWTYVKKDGSHFPVQVSVTAIKNNSNEIIGYLGIAIDISKIKDAEKALRENEQQLQLALEGSKEGIWDLNLESKSIFFSKQGKSILGYEDNEISDNNKNFISKVHPSDKYNVLKQYKEYIQGKTDTFISELRIQTNDNSYRWVAIRGRIFEWIKPNKPLRIMGTFHDISWRKEKELELALAIDIVSEQNKRLLNFTYIVSHNLRTHSANFELGFNLLNDESSSIEEKLDIIQQLKSVSEKLSDTINNLNEVIAIQSNINTQRKKINLQLYIQNTLTILSGEIDLHQVIIENKIPKTLEIKYNPAYLESILLNLLTNAIKYRNLDQKPYIILSCTNGESNTLILHIEDNGIGIDMKRHGKDLFGMYKTFHRNIDAKGIGLFITKNQVEAMGGKIEVQSEVGKGTTFSIHLAESGILSKKAN